jgi:hypothetical protein
MDADYISRLIELLEAEYPQALCSLNYGSDWQLLFATRLAAQCTDERVNMITPELFSKYPTLSALAEAEPEAVEKIIHSCGFFRSKARDLIEASKLLLAEYGGRVPDTMEELLKLPGLGERRQTSYWATSTISRPSSQTRTAYGLPTAWGLPIAKIRTRWSCVWRKSYLRKSSPTSATGWCSTAQILYGEKA